MGALVNVAYNRFYYNNAIRYVNGGVDPVANSKATLPAGEAADFRLPYSVGMYYPRGLRERPSVNGSFQWKPADNFEFYADGLWQAFRNQGSNESFDVSLLRAAPKNAAGVEVPPTLSNIVRVDGEPNKLVSVSKTGGYPAEMYRSASRDFTNTYQAAAGFIWNTGRAVISSDFAYTFSEYGAQANLTYVDAKNQLPRALGTAQPMVTLTGLSKWSYNLSGFYERDKISLRLSYNYRSSFVDFYSRNSSDVQYTGQTSRPVSRLDFSGSYTPIENITLTAEVTNILAQPYSNFRYFNETQYYPIDVRYEGRYFSLGARFRF